MVLEEKSVGSRFAFCSISKHTTSKKGPIYREIDRGSPISQNQRDPETLELKDSGLLEDEFKRRDSEELKLVRKY